MDRCVSVRVRTSAEIEGVLELVNLPMREQRTRRSCSQLVSDLIDVECFTSDVFEITNFNLHA